MKLKLIIIICVFFGLKSFCQTVDSTQMLNEDLITKKVKEVIGENEYIRVPLTNFENDIQSKISATINKRINNLIGFLVAIIGILSALSIIQSNRSRNILKEQVLAQISADLNSKTVESREFFEGIINSRLEDIEKQLLGKLELQYKSNVENIKNVENQLEQSKSQIAKAEDYLINIEFESLKKMLRERKYDYAITLKRLTTLLKDVEDKKRKALIPDIVDLLTLIYYDYKNYNEVTDLINKYEGKIKFKSSSYVNAALTGIYDYHNYNSVNQRAQALIYLDKSLELIQGYGSALALKLEIFMMDYLRAEEDKQKDQAIKDAKSVFNKILKSESGAPSYETISRLTRDSKLASYKKYFDKLNELFAEELKQMQLKADEYSKSIKK
ncbi:hypothetical protein [Hwangdonia lutea]|uniref:Uncharacterized protein n=1 Tax=Hwangdonia lutea TaxID=3075823 RepID=A0AA97HNW6_9FLAO|nr:hypothetical protein [Hwangdonia sp. SCSIO 19198]WOD42451.1 hypothetical protein RNZ46_10650 [Hwangdonia sp. SCSIO 19198]